MSSPRSGEDAFLGSGWAFPVETEADAVEVASGEDAIEDAIRVVLGTAKGERVMRPEFGCGIHEYVFETIDTSTRTLVETAVEDALVEWEPRIEVLAVTTSTERLSEGVLSIGVDYRVRQTNTERNLVYPFYVGGE